MLGIEIHSRKYRANAWFIIHYSGDAQIVHVAWFPSLSAILESPLAMIGRILDTSLCGHKILNSSSTVHVLAVSIVPIL